MANNIDDKAFRYSEAQVQEDGFVLSDPEVVKSYSTPIAEAKAQKYAYTFGFDPEQAKNMLDSNQEDAILNTARAITASKMETVRARAAEFALGQGEVDTALDIRRNAKEINPVTLAEREFSHKLSIELPFMFSNSAKEKYLNNPEILDQFLAASTTGFTWKEVANSVIAEFDNLSKSLSLGNKISDTAELFLPGFSMYNFRTAARDLPDKGILPSTNITALVESVYRLSPEEGKVRATEIMKELLDQNFYQAHDFVAALKSYSNTDKFWDNVLYSASAANLAPLAIPLRKVLVNASNHIGANGISIGGLNAAAGNLQGAAHAQATNRFIRLAKTTGNDDTVDVMMNTAPSFMDPRRVVQPTQNLSAVMTDRIVRNLEGNRDKLLNIVNEAISVKRLDEETPALAAAYAEADAKIRAHYQTINNAILDIRHVNADETLANVAFSEARVGKAEATAAVSVNPKTGQTSVQISVGKPTSDFFDSKAQAETYAQSYGLQKGSYSVIEDAPDKHYLAIIQHIDENSPVVYQNLLTELRGQDFNDWRSIFLRKMGSQEALLAPAMSANRNVGIHGTNKVLNDIAEHFRSELIKPLRKEEQTRLQQFITYERDYENLPQDIIGKFSANQAELETEWLRRHRRLPSEAESQAYWSYVQISDYDWVLRNLSDYTQMSSAGWEMVGIKAVTEAPNLEGKIIQSLNNLGIPHEPRIAVVERGVHSIISRTRAEQLMNQGYQAAQLHSMGMQKADGLGFRNVDILVSRDLTRAPLSWERVAYRPGGHRIYQDEWFISAEIMQGSTYIRDFNIGSHMIRDQAQILVDRWNTARGMHRNADPALDNFVRDNLPTNPARFRQLYDDGVLDINTVVKLRRKDTSLADAYPLKQQYENFTRHPGSVGEAREQTAFLGKRSARLPSASYDGSPTNPVMRVQSARLLDPYSAIVRSLNSNLRGLYMDDMKLRHMQDFIARYGDLLEDPNTIQARLNPYYHALESKFKESTTDLDRLVSAKAYRRSIENFLGIESEQQAMVKTFNERLLGSVYSRNPQTAELLEPYLMHRMTDPIKFLRASAFHTKIGLFHLPSFLTQLMQFSNTLGIAGPVAAADALAWAQYARLMRKSNPAVQSTLAAKAGAWGGSANDFMEYYRGLERSGLLHVHGEIADLDIDKSFKVTRSAAQTFLDWGRAPFDQGEKLSRLIGFQIAYREWRNGAGAVAKLSDDALRTVMRRTDVLTGNMTRASISSWQTGVLSVPTQFFNWHLRMTEQMLGTTLTDVEKSRLMLTNAVLYGAPAALTTAPLTQLIPWSKMAETFTNAYGVPIDENNNTAMFYTAMLQGGAAAFTKAIVGDAFNFNKRFGPGLLNPIYDALFSDEKTFFDVITGVAGSTIQDIAKGSVPFIAHIAARVNGDPGDLQVSDLTGAIVHSVSSLSSAERLIAALNAGKYISKNDTRVADLPEWKAWLNFMTGLQPREISSLSEKKDYLSTIKSIQRTLEPTMLKTHRALYETLSTNDYVKAEQLQKKLESLYVLSGMTSRERTSFELKSFRGMDKTTYQKVNEQLSKRNQTQFDRILREQKDKQ